MNTLTATAIGICALIAATGAQALPAVQFDPSFQSVAVGQVFDVVLQGLGFNLTSSGAVIGNLTGGQKLNFSYSNTSLEVMKVTIDPRWTFTSGNKEGTIDQAAGTVTGVAFGSFPATTDDDFNIATFTLKALAPGQGALSLVSGQFIGLVNNKAGQLITPTTGQAAVNVVPEPEQWALLLAGLGLVGLRLRRR